MDIPKITYTGKIKEVTLGTGGKAVTVGGETMYPLHLFEGQMPHPPRVAMEVYDAPPEDWARLDGAEDIATRVLRIEAAPFSEEITLEPTIARAG